MNLFRVVVVSAMLMLYFSGDAVLQELDDDSLPPEKTQLIYDTLLPSEGVESGKFDTTDSPGATMTVEKIAQILSGKDIDLQGKTGQWQFFYEGVQIFLLADPCNNRIRMMTPLARLDQLRRHAEFSEIELLQKMMKANYLATGDIRFCMNKHILWAAFLHPLDSLTERDFAGALEQLTQTVKKTRSDFE